MHRNTIFLVVLLTLQTIYNSIVSTIGQYIYGYFLQLYSNNGSHFNHSLASISHVNLVEFQVEKCFSNSTDNINHSAQIWAQEKSADLLFRATLWRAVPVIVITYFFGFYGTRLNRHAVLVMSIFGNALHVVIYQAIIYGQLDEYWWYIAAAVAGLAGGTNIINILTNLMITEHTEEFNRSAYFVRIGALTTAISAIFTFAIGYYIEWRGFTDLLWSAIGVELLSILSVFLYNKPNDDSIASSTSTLIETRQLTSSNPLLSFKGYDLLSFHYQSRQQAINVTLVLCAYIFYFFAFSSLSTLLWYLLSTPFCWTSKDLGNFFSLSSILTAILSMIGMKIFQCAKLHDALICLFGHVCFFGYALLIAFAKYSWQLYVSLLMYSFSSYQASLTVPMLTRWLNVNKRSQAYTLLTIINTIMLAFGSSMFNWIYARTVSYEKNFTLLLASGLSLIPAFLNLLLFISDRRHLTRQTIENTVSISNSISETSALLSSHEDLSPTGNMSTTLVTSGSFDSFYGATNNPELLINGSTITF